MENIGQANVFHEFLVFPRFLADPRRFSGKPQIHGKHWPGQCFPLFFHRSSWKTLARFHGPPAVSSAWQALVRHGHSVSSSGPYLWSAVSQDQRGLELQRTLEAVDRAKSEGRLKVIVIDLPRQADVALVTKELRSRGLECTSTSYRTSDLGVSAARRRQCICGFSGSQCPQLEPFGRYQVQDPPTLRQLPLEVQPSENLFVDGKVTVEPTIMTTGDPCLPHPAGHVHAEGTKHLLHSDALAKRTSSRAMVELCCWLMEAELGRYRPVRLLGFKA